MGKTKVEQVFHLIDHLAELIQKESDEPYLDSLAIALEVLFYEDIPNEWKDTEISSALKEADLSAYSVDELRKGIQFAILKGMKDSVQSQHMMTPESVALLIGYFAEQLMEKRKSIRLFDPASGTGNLLLTVMERLKEKRIVAYASEVDPTLIRLSVASSNLQKKQVEYFHQDSLRPLLLDPVDLVIADLPVGYYPDDVRAQEFQLKADEGHSYAHHLFIEQSLLYTKEAGFLIFVIPEFLFDSDQSDRLRQFLYDHAHIVGIIRLPDTAFKSKQVKSILILQKKGEHTKTVKQPLLVQMPSFKNHHAMANILAQMNKWFDTNKGKLL